MFDSLGIDAKARNLRKLFISETGNFKCPSIKLRACFGKIYSAILSVQEEKIALTLSLSHRNGRGDLSIARAPEFLPSPACGRGRGWGCSSTPRLFSNFVTFVVSIS